MADNVLYYGDNLDILRRYVKNETVDQVYTSLWNPAKPQPRLQILTIKELLDGKRIDMPPPGQVNVTFQRAPRARGEVSGPGQLSLLGDEG